MGIATSILDTMTSRWGHINNFIEETRGHPISLRESEKYIEDYLEHHRVPGKLQIRWVDDLNSGGRLQEWGPRGDPTKRRLRLWINKNFEGIAFSKSIVSFTDHEICTHALRALNDHVQVWANNRCKFSLQGMGTRKSAATEEGLASLNALLSYPDRHRYLWSAALLYYCAVKGQEMGFRELHEHLFKYLQSASKRYWYCVRVKGKNEDLNKPGACGKGQVYLEGAVEIIRNLDNINFHHLFSGRVPLGKLGRIKNLVRTSLVTLPRFMENQTIYKAMLRQIGELNGIISKKPQAPLRMSMKLRRTQSEGGQGTTCRESKSAKSHSNAQRATTIHFSHNAKSRHGRRKIETLVPSVGDQYDVGIMARCAWQSPSTVHFQDENPHVQDISKITNTRLLLDYK